MKPSLNCYATRYMNNKLINSGKCLNFHLHQKTSPLTITTISHQTSKSKTKTHVKNRTNTSLTEASLDTEANLNNVNAKTKSLSCIPQSNSSIISAYEQSLIHLFSYLKDILDGANYQQTKKVFFEELEKNLLIPAKSEYSSFNNNNNNNKTSTLSSSNSIMSMLQESKQKCCLMLPNNSNAKCSYTNAMNMKNKSLSTSKQNFQSHKSLYTLSKPGKKVNTSSPEKPVNTKHNFLHHYYKSFHTHNNGAAKRKEKNKSNNISNISVPNIINNLNYQMKGYLYKDYCNKNENKTYNDDIVNHNKRPQEENTSELLSQIKNSLDDNLKGFFEFSYENFLNKETERECTTRSRIPPK